MANTLTSLIPTIYEALDVVSREMIGFIPAVARNSSAERAALNETILVPVTQAQSAQDVTPGVIPPDTGDQTIGNVSMTIQKSKMVPIRWNGEQQKGMKNSGTYNAVLREQFAQGFRTLANLVETDLFNAAYQNASRAYGTAGTAPFGTAADLSDASNLRKILDDNGCPQTDLHLVLGSAAVNNLRGKQSLLLKTNEMGSDAFRKTGQIADVPLSGFMLHNSNSIKQVTKGTGASYQLNGALSAAATTAVVDTGTGTILAGDVISFSDDSTDKYVVNSALSAGSLSIGAPGLINAEADNTTFTLSNSYTPNVGFTRSAIQLITRAPAMPLDEDGRPMDLAEDVQLVTDPVSGITFEVSMYKQYRQMVYYVALAWGANAIKSNHIAILQG